MKGSAVIRSTGIVSGFTLISRGLGMLRDILFAYHFGTSLTASAFFVAFTIPNLFRRLFGEGALSAAFIPVFIETRSLEGEIEAWKTASKISTMSAVVLTLTALLGVLLFSAALQIPGLSERWETTFELSRILFPYVAPICFSAFVMAILNSLGHFAISAFAPCLLNLVLIAVMLAVFPAIGSDSAVRAQMLAWGVLLAGFAQVAVQLPVLKRFGFPFKCSFRWHDPRAQRVLMLLGPAAFGLAVTQFNVLIDRLLAMWIGGWAPAVLFYSERMIYFPIGIIAAALSSVLLPAFSAHVSGEDFDALRETLTCSLRQSTFIMMPAALGLLVLAPDIIAGVFEWNGRFDATSVRLTARALAGYAPGLVVFGAVKVLVPAFYAMQDTKTPVRVAICVIFLNLIMNIAFILTLPEYWKHVGMALSTVFSESFGMVVLGGILSRRVRNIQWFEILGCFVRSLVCALVMTACAVLAIRASATFLDGFLSGKFVQISSVILAVLTGVFVYFLFARILKAPELREIAAAFKRK